MIGGSAGGLECVTDDSHISMLLSEKTGKKIGFSSIVASYKTFSDSIKIIEELKDANVTFLFGLEPYLFYKSPSMEFQFEKKGRPIRKYHFLKVPDSYADFLSAQKIDVPLAQHFISMNMYPVLGEMFKKMIINPIKGKSVKYEYDRHRISKKKKPLTAEKADKLAKKITSTKKKAYLANWKQQDILFRTLVKYVREQPGNSIVFFDLPQPDVLVPALEIMAPDYLDRLSGIIKEYNLYYMNFQADGPWVKGYYHDAHHMIEPGRIRFTDVLADGLAEYILAPKTSWQNTISKANN